MKLSGRSSCLELWGIVVLVPVLAAVGVCADRPSKTIHAIVQMSASEIPKDSFFSKPKVFWRASDRYCRVDEEPDTERGHSREDDRERA